MSFFFDFADFIWTNYKKHIIIFTKSRWRFARENITSINMKIFIMIKKFDLKIQNFLISFANPKYFSVLWGKPPKAPVQVPFEKGVPFLKLWEKNQIRSESFFSKISQ